ncbi:MAG: hypothetical protein OXE58_01200 [Acidobacteria bacterium]|nr:hypothetical protein [Acidobacteriota bacterium]
MNIARIHRYPQLLVRGFGSLAEPFVGRTGGAGAHLQEGPASDLAGLAAGRVSTQTVRDYRQQRCAVASGGRTSVPQASS